MSAHRQKNQIKMNTATYEIRRPETFAKMFAFLQRKATRLGLPVPSYKVTGQRLEKDAPIYQIEGSQKVRIGQEDLVLTTIEVSGLQSISFNGWSLAASVEPTAKGNLLWTVPGVTVPARFEHTGCACEHCKVDRDRKRLYVVTHEGGESKQVGSTCLADFLGGNSADALAAKFGFYGEILRELKEYCDGESGGWGGNKGYDLSTVIARAYDLEQEHGWTGSVKAREEMTLSIKDRVLNWSKDTPCRIPTAAAYERADIAIEHFRNLSPDGQDDFCRNARLIASAGFASFKSMGLAAALSHCYDIHLSRLERAKVAANLAETSQHFGTLKERVKGLTGKVLKVLTFPGDFGVTIKILMVTPEGNSMVSTGLYPLEKSDDPQSARLPVIGETVRFTATIVEHGEYNGVKQTKVNRPKDAVLVP